MFSATFPDDIQQAAQEFLVDYLFLTVGMVGGVCSDVEQVFHEVSKFEKRDKLEELMQDPSRDSKERTLVFVQVSYLVQKILNNPHRFFIDKEECRFSGHIFIRGRFTHYKHSWRSLTERT